MWRGERTLVGGKIGMKNRLMCAAVLALTILGGQTARAGIVFDSITGANSVGLLSIASDGPLGDSFSTVATSYLLSDVKVNFYNPSATTTGSVTVTLYASNGVSPTTALATLGTVNTSAVATGTFLVEDFSSFAPISLAPSTRYYIILSTTNSALDAVITNTLTGPEVSSEFNYYNGTAQSNVSVGGTFEMQVSTVPEPSSLVLCGIAGLGSLGYYARRRRASIAN
jgi:hypothetical protein